MYLIIVVLLVLAELLYFRIAGHFNIIDKPNERSSHSSVVLRGGGIIFTVSMIFWMAWQMAAGELETVTEYLPFFIGLLLIAGVSFWDDVRSLPDSVRLLAQFIAMGLLFQTMGILHWNMWWIVILSLIVFVGATDIFNFMDGINGITAAFSLAVLLPLIIVNGTVGFIEPSYLAVAALGVLVFAFFNFRPKGKARCFAGDVGSIGIAFILLLAIGRLMVKTGDVTYLIVLLVYGIDGVLTILHRILLHENLGEAHRKHAYQIMANELGMSHVTVSLVYMALQLAVSLGFIFLCPDTVAAHWIYLACVFVALVAGYIVFMKKYYHLHEEYLESLKDAR